MAKHSDIWDRIFSDITAKAIFIASMVYVLVIASYGWNGMLSHLHAFRQTQTAISASYLLKGGPWLAYETPIFGPPWSAPMEFPFYQWIVALVASSNLFALDQAGRFVSELFFFSSLYPLFKMLGILKLSARQRYLILTLFCISPQYLFWSRTFMIESTALALSMYFLWLVFLCCEQFAGKRINWLAVTGMAAFGVLAGLVKVTTFFSFLAGACMVVAFYGYQKYREEGFQNKSVLALSLLFFSAVLVPFLAVVAWTNYADSIKSLNPFAVPWTSTNLKSWNFGTLEQKLSLKTWQSFYSVILANLVGNSLLAVIAVMALFLCSKKRIWIALGSFWLFLLALLTFTNLHYVHTYYSYANGVFFIVALGVIVSDLLECRNVLKRTVGATLFCLMVFFCVQNFYSGYWTFQKQDFNFSPITSAINAHSSENDVFIVFGTKGSAEIPYRINRRVVSIISGDLNDPALVALKERLKGYRIGGVLFYSRIGFGHLKENEFAVMSNIARFFQIRPGFDDIYPWYKSGSAMIIMFNGAK